MPTQIAELKRLFGEVDVEMDPAPFDNAEQIIKRAKGFDEVVVVAPLSVIQRLTELGVKPLYAIMEPTDKSRAEVTSSGRSYRFVKFKRIVGVKIEFEEI